MRFTNWEQSAIDHQIEYAMVEKKCIDRFFVFAAGLKTTWNQSIIKLVSHLVPAHEKSS